MPNMRKAPFFSSSISWISEADRMMTQAFPSPKGIWHGYCVLDWETIWQCEL